MGAFHRQSFDTRNAEHRAVDDVAVPPVYRGLHATGTDDNQAPRRSACAL